MSKQPKDCRFPPGLRAQLRIINALDSIEVEHAYWKCAYAARDGHLPTKRYDEILKDGIKLDADYYTIQGHLDSVRKMGTKFVHRLNLIKDNLPGHLHKVLLDLLFEPVDESDDDDDEPKSCEISESLMDSLSGGGIEIERTPVELSLMMEKLTL